jgi:hypothetical protein
MNDRGTAMNDRGTGAHWKRAHPMETLPQPYVWTCNRCQQPIDAWDLEVQPNLQAPLCSDCLLPPFQPDDPGEAHLRYWLIRRARESTGNPPGTLLGRRGASGEGIPIRI